MARAPRDAAKVDAASAVQRNVAAIAAVEEEARRVRTPTARTIDAIAQFLGRPVFLSVQAMWMAAWIAWNLIEPGRAFDRPPFFRLDTILSIEAIVISTFVLISQNRMATTDNRREHLNLQVSLLAEAEMTNALNMLHRISRHLGLPDTANDAEARELAKRTDIVEVARHVDEQLAPDPATAAAAGKSPDRSPGLPDTTR